MARSHEDGVTTSSGVRPVKSAERTVQLLEYLAAEPSGRTLRQIQDDLGMPRSSTYALLMTLQRKGWVETDMSGSRYRTGVRALLVGASYVEHDDVVRRTAGVMDELSNDLGETIHLARLEGDGIVYLATRISRHPLGVISRVGRRLPAHLTALGKALLAERTRDEVERLLPAKLERLTRNTITDITELHAELQRTRRRGYAIDNEEGTPGIKCFAVALRLSTPATYALSCSMPAVRVTTSHRDTVVKALTTARDRI